MLGNNAMLLSMYEMLWSHLFDDYLCCPLASFIIASHSRLILTFQEAVAMLRENGVEMGDFEDLRWVEQW